MCSYCSTDTLLQYYPTPATVRLLHAKCLQQGEEREGLEDAIATALRNARSHITKAARTEIVKHMDCQEHPDTKKHVVCMCLCCGLHDQLCQS